MTRILFLIFLSVSFFAVGQNGKKNNYTVYINYPDYSVKAEVVSSPLKIYTKKELEYYWYSSNKIIKTEGGSEGKILNGAYTSFYLSNNLKEKGTFKNGLKTGEWISWFENGMISEIILWSNGLKSGSSKRFNEKGELISEAHYKNGKLNGYQLVYENEMSVSKKKFKRGVEIIKKKKIVKEKQEKDIKSTEKQMDDKTNAKKEIIPGNKKENKTDLKSKLRLLFKKKDKKEKELKDDNKTNELAQKKNK